jgi:SAM-dependent methyltransferase
MMRIERLAPRAVPRATTADPRLRDRRSAARALLAVASVDAELLLHRAGRAVGCPVVAQRRALALDARSQRCTDGASEPCDLGGGEFVRRAQGAHPRPPERLVGVDVPEAGDDSLVEEDGLERRPPACQLRAEPARREARAERLRAVLGREVGLELGVLEDEPRSESPHVAIDEPRAVVERDHGALVRQRREAEAPGHPQVDEECEPALEAQKQVLASTLDGDHDVALELLRDLEEIGRPRQAWVEDLHPRERSPLEARRELRPDRLYLGELGHSRIVGLAARVTEPPQTWHYGLIARYWGEFNDDFRMHEVPYFQKFIEGDGQPALDVACGTGRLLLPYLRAGLDVDGCDVSADMIAVCREKARSEGLSPNLYVQPMHALDLPHRYRTIFVCGAFGLGSDRERDGAALRGFHDWLEPGGTLLLDMEVPYADAKQWSFWLKDGRASLPEAARPPGRRRAASDGAEYALRSRYLELDPLDQRVSLDMRIELWRDGALEAEEDHRLDIGLYFKNEVLMMLERAGFADVVVHGDHVEAAPTPEDEFIVFVATR